MISGTPTASGTFGFKAQVRDVNSTPRTKRAITINPKPSLSSPACARERPISTKYQRRAGAKLHGPIFLLVDELDDALRHQLARRSFTITDSNARPPPGSIECSSDRK